MYVRVIRFQDEPNDLAAGIEHGRDEVVPAADATPGVQELWLVDRDSDERLSVMLFADESAAHAMFALVGETRTADPDRPRPKPQSSTRHQVYAQTRSLSRSGA